MGRARAFGWGAGVLLLAIAMGVSGSVLLEALAPVRPDAVPLGLSVAPGEVAVGTLVFTSKDGTFFASILYSRIGVDALNERLDALDPFVDERGRPGSLPCAGPTCPLSPIDASTRKVYDHLRNGTTKLATDLGVDATLASISEARIEQDGVTLIVSFGRVDTPETPRASGALAPMTTLLEKLKETCDVSDVPQCVRRTVALSMIAEWDPAFGRFAEFDRPANTSVVGPLSWTSMKTPASSPQTIRNAQRDVAPLAVPGLVFMPTSLLVVMLLGFLASFLVNPISALLAGEPILPTPLLGAAVAAGGYALIAKGIHFGPPWVALALLFLVVYVLVFLIYRTQPPSLLDTFSALWAIVALVLVGWWIVSSIVSIRLLEPLALLDLLFGAEMYGRGERIYWGTVLILGWAFLVGVLVVVATELYSRRDDDGPNGPGELAKARAERMDEIKERSWTLGQLRREMFDLKGGLRGLPSRTYATYGFDAGPRPRGYRDLARRRRGI